MYMFCREALDTIILKSQTFMKNGMILLLVTPVVCCVSGFCSKKGCYVMHTGFMHSSDQEMCKQYSCSVHLNFYFPVLLACFLQVKGLVNTILCFR